MVMNVKFGSGMNHEREVISVKSKADDAKLSGHIPKT
jgi:hypothetical protein